MTSLYIVLNQIKTIAEEAAQSLGKPTQVFLPEADTPIPDSWLFSLNVVLTHLVRNSIDHGFTNRGGDIWFRTPPSSSSSMWTLEIEDSGIGVSLEKIKSRAIEHGLIKSDDTPSRNALLEFLFYPGFTTQDTPNLYSGHGIGMDVVRHEIVKLGGQIHLIQNENRGLMIRIEIPKPSQ